MASTRYPQRVRNDLRFRELTVRRVERVSAGFQRIVLGGEAVEAKVGDRLTIGGPRGSLVVPEDYAWQLYVCDESGMPALRRRLESIAKLPVCPEIHAVVTVGDESYKDYLAHLSDFNITWVVGHSEQAVADRLAALAVPAEDYFIWLTGEGKVVKSLSRQFETNAIDQHLVRASAYWHAK